MSKPRDEMTGLDETDKGGRNACDECMPCCYVGNGQYCDYDCSQCRPCDGCDGLVPRYCCPCTRDPQCYDRMEEEEFLREMELADQEAVDRGEAEAANERDSFGDPEPTIVFEEYPEPLPPKLRSERRIGPRERWIKVAKPCPPRWHRPRHSTE